MKTKILYLTPDGLGGMAQLGHDLTKINFSKWQFKVFFTKSGHNNGSIDVLPRLVHLAWVTLTWRPDYIWVNLGTRGSIYRKALFVFISSLLLRRTILQVHSGHLPKDLETMPKLAIKIVEFMFLRSVAILGQSENVNQWIIDRFPQKVDQIHVLQNFSIPMVSLEPTALGGAKPLKMLYAGRLDERKGILDLLSACQKLDLEEDKWQLVVAGEGALEEEIRERIREHNLERNVSLLPWIADRRELLSLIDSSDIVVLPSYAENAPLIVIESFSRGRPVLTTNVGALDTMVSHAIDGFIFQPADISTLKTIIITLTKYPEKLIHLGENARCKYFREFTPEVFGKKLEEILGPNRFGRSI
jgi:glycosyltransferase involved in cell wall biosynthesis